MSITRPVFITIFEDEPIVDACYDIEELCFDYVWFLQVYKENADGNPIVKIEASNDGIHWDSWGECNGTTELDTDSTSFKDHYFGAKFIRVCVEANGTTTGTISANINLKSP